MDTPSLLLTWPGEWLVERLFAGDFPTPSEARADLAITLGVACWVLACLLLALAWRFAAARLRVAGRASARAAPQWLRRPAVTWGQAWGAAWRAQAVHLALYAALPLLWEATRLVLLAATLPLWVIGPGSGPGATDGTLDHLRRPECWTFVTLCPGPRSRWLHTPVVESAACSAPGVCPPARPRLRDRDGWAAKGLWAGLTLGWIVWWRLGYRRRHHPEVP